MAARFKLQPAIAIVLALVLFLAINLFGALKLDNRRLDLTQHSLYTLGSGSLSIIAQLSEPVTIRLYQTRQLIDAVPALQVHATQVTQLLASFTEASGGKIKLDIIETLPFSAEEDQALGFGLAGFNLNASGERGYFGIVGTNSLDTLETIDFLDPARQAFLQYDLTRLVYRLSRPSETQVAVMDGLSMYGSLASNKRPWAILDLLGQDYDLQSVPPNAPAIPAGTDVLLLAHPAILTPEQQFAVDQYVLGGGAALVFLDPLAENSTPDTQNPNRPQNPSSDLAPLMAAWGARLDPDAIVGDKTMAMETVGVAGQQRVVADYLPWLRVDGAQFNPDEPITARLQAMRLSSAGAITALPGATTSLTPLLSSTTASMLFPRATIMARPNPNVLLDQFKPSGQRQILAARITGPAKTAFPDGPPKSADAPATPLPGAAAPLTQSAGPINVIVVADSDMLADSHVIGQDGRISTSNANFVLNAVGDLAGGDELINVRGGGETSRPFTSVQAIQDQAESRYRSTEQRLSQELADIQQSLLQLQGPQDGDTLNALTLSREQQAAVTQYNLRIADLRTQLRAVRSALKAEISTLDTRLKLVNIVLVPLLLIAIMALLALWRSLRLRRYLRRQRATPGVQ